MPMKIEDTLFNVHKYQLMKSETFSDMFGTAQGDTEEGSSPEKPIVIEGVAASDFECLLTVLYATTTVLFPSHFSTHQPVPEASLIIPAFRLANKWNFEDLRTYLLPLAEKELNDVDKIIFAREFDIKAWLAPAHTQLCQRAEPLTTDEAEKLGIHSLLLISRLREESCRPTASGVYTCGPCIGYRYTSSGGTCNKCSAYGHTLTLANTTRPVDTSIRPKPYVSELYGFLTILVFTQTAHNSVTTPGIVLAPFEYVPGWAFASDSTSIWYGTVHLLRATTSRSVSSMSDSPKKDGADSSSDGAPAASPVVKTRHSKFYFDNTLVSGASTAQVPLEGDAAPALIHVDDAASGMHAAVDKLHLEPTPSSILQQATMWRKPSDFKARSNTWALEITYSFGD
ncbi:hypothetical protein FRC10_010317 [Ceratobasidium sp. 414]|nr:hypothetical protein FRC10_010317 [Ceratobasidium sp. 414]